MRARFLPPLVAILALAPALGDSGERRAPPAPERQSVEQAEAKSAGCASCHVATDRHTMHQNPGVVLGCADCHGGDARVRVEGNSKREDPAYREAHLRAPRDACGACHLAIVQASERSLMATSAMLWGGAAYNNGILPFKRYILGEAYTREGEGAAVVNPMKPNDVPTEKGILPGLTALPAWESTPPADVFRIFERGGRVISSQFPEVGRSNSAGALQKLDEPGRPDIRASNRGPATGSRI